MKIESLIVCKDNVNWLIEGIETDGDEIQDIDRVFLFNRNAKIEIMVDDFWAIFDANNEIRTDLQNQVEEAWAEEIYRSGDCDPGFDPTGKKHGVSFL